MYAIRSYYEIQLLESENEKLRGQVTAFQTRISELEGLVHAFKDDQGRIEEGILNALDRLSAFEDSVLAQTDLMTETIVETSESVENVAIETETAEEETEDEDLIVSEVSDSESDKQPGFDLDDTESNGQMDIF